VTGTSISVHAVERSRTFLDYSRDIQVLSRLLNYATALQEIAKHPVLGAGQGATVTSYSFDPETNRFETWRAWTLDNLYLTLWLKLGLAGLILFPWFCIGVARAGVRVFHKTREPSERAFAAAVVATLAGMALLGISDGSMVNGRFAAVFAVLFGLVMVLDADDERSVGLE
jgi:O-antigen ligase